MLTARLVDRPLRPMFAPAWAHDTQVLIWVLSYDGVHSPEPLAITAAAAALCISGARSGGCILADTCKVAACCLQKCSQSQQGPCRSTWECSSFAPREIAPLLGKAVNRYCVKLCSYCAYL